MISLTRHSLATIASAVLSAVSIQVQAQSTPLPGAGVPPDSAPDAQGIQGRQGTGISPSANSGARNNGGTPSNTLQSLPTEPTSAGYASSNSSYSWLPYTTSGYVGLSIGNGKLNTDCLPGLSCDDFKGAVNVFTGGMFTPNFGLQLGYFRLGDADRNGGTTKVSGVNLVLTGVAPLSQTFSLVGRVGGTYGWTDTSVGLGVPAAAGSRNGFGASYGAGLSWDFDRNWSATLDWDRHHLKYAGDEKINTDVATIGFKYRF